MTQMTSDMTTIKVICVHLRHLRTIPKTVRQALKPALASSKPSARANAFLNQKVAIARASVVHSRRTSEETSSH